MNTPPLPVPLNQKLGIKPGHTICVLNAPADFLIALGTQLSQVRIVQELVEDADVIHIFSTKKDDLEASFPELKNMLGKNHALWISWPKKIAGIPTDLNENIVREIGLKNGLADVKVCAIDEWWSGIKFVYRLKNR